MAPTSGFEFFPLTAGDPTVLVAEGSAAGNIRLEHRLKPGHAGFQDAKLVGFFGYDQAGLPVVVKVARDPAAADVEQLLDNERHGSAYSSSGRGQGFQWVSRPYVPGISLERAAREPDYRSTLPTLTKLLLRQIATVHRSGRYHGDIKPQNAIVVGSQDNQATVVIDAPPPAKDSTTVLPSFPGTQPAAIDLSDPQIKLIDFEAGGTTNQRNTRQATYRYASPEQLNQRPIGQPSDVFSWGLTTLAVFAPDAHPFLPAGTALNNQNIADAMGDPSPQLRTDILWAIPDDALRLAVRRALTIDPAHRPSAEALLADLSLAPSEVADVATRLSDTMLLPATGLGSGTKVLPDSPSGADELALVEPHLPDDFAHLLRPAGPLGNETLTLTDRAIVAAVVTVGAFLTALLVFVLVSALIGRLL